MRSLIGKPFVRNRPVNEPQIFATYGLTDCPLFPGMDLHRRFSSGSINPNLGIRRLATLSCRQHGDRFQIESDAVQIRSRQVSVGKACSIQTEESRSCVASRMRRTALYV